MEAGIEHLGRGTAMGVDVMLIVVEPGKRSIETARRVREMGRELGIRRFGIVLNKSMNAAEDRDWIITELGEEDLLAVIPFDGRIAQADRLGLSVIELGCEELLPPFRSLGKALIQISEQGEQHEF
jgi:CO dehydrogenase maturation factor